MIARNSRDELDRVGPAQRALVEDFFARAVEIELAFFDATYESPLSHRPGRVG